jgi:hypothetical protein
MTANADTCPKCGRRFTTKFTLVLGLLGVVVLVAVIVILVQHARAPLPASP